MTDMHANPSRAHTVLDAISSLVATGGREAVTMRAIASASRVSLGALHTHFTDKARLIGLAAVWSGDHHLDAMVRRTEREGFPGFLPRDMDEILRVRVWLAWRDLGRSDLLIGQRTGLIEAEERRLVAHVHRRFSAQPEGSILDEAALDALVALIRGLTVAVCALDDPWSWERACAALEFHRARAA